MSREKIWIVSIIVAMSSAVICMASIFFSYRVHVSSRKLVAEYRNDLFALRQSYAELEKQFTNIANKQKLFQNKPVETKFSHSPLKIPPSHWKAGMGPPLITAKRFNKSHKLSAPPDWINWQSTKTSIPQY